MTNAEASGNFFFMIKNKLSFAKGNAKLGKSIAIFSLPAGYTCPSALNCLSFANRATGKIKDGIETQFRCYAASGESLFAVVRKSRWHNFETLRGKTIEQMVGIINLSIPRKNTTHVRIHASGDFFTQDYFDAWLKVARINPALTFYAYTKQLPLWIARKGQIPNNLHLVASRGGVHDKLIGQHRLRSVRVVYTEKQAERLNIPIDHDDSHAWKTKRNFALLLHGTQPAKSKAAKAWHIIKTQGRGGYKADYFKSYSK